MSMIEIPSLEYLQIKDLAEQVKEEDQKSFVQRLSHAMPAIAGKLPPLEKMQTETAEFIQEHGWVSDIRTKQDFESLLQPIDFSNDDNLRRIFGETGIEKKVDILKAIADIMKMPSGYERPFHEDGLDVYCSGTREEQVRHRQQVDMGHALDDFFRAVRSGFSKREDWSNDPIEKMRIMVSQKEIDWLKQQPETTQTLMWLLTNVYRQANGDAIPGQFFQPALKALREKDPDQWPASTGYSSDEVLTAAKGLYDIQEIILSAAREANKSAKVFHMNSERNGTLRGKIDQVSGTLAIFNNFTDLEPVRDQISEIAIGTARIPVAVLEHLARNPRALENALKEAGITPDKKQAMR